jgi:hypothetical protein
VVQAQRRERLHSLDWADPLIGVRWLPALDAVDIDFRGDTAVRGEPDLTWGSSATCDCGCRAAPYAVLGYRVDANDRSTSGADVDLQMRGPVLGAGLVF